jgi:hypothetical protein
VRVDDPGACELLQSLHLDHTHDVGNVCSVWRASVPKGGRRWSAGIDRARLCRMLLGVTAADGLEQCLQFSSRKQRPAACGVCLAVLQPRGELQAQPTTRSL